MSHMPPPRLPEHDPSDPRDSVPPLSASETGRVRAYRPRRRSPLAPLAIVFAVGLTGGAALSARSLRLPSPTPASDADVPDHSGVPDAPLLPAPALDGYDDDEPPTLEAQRARLFQRMRDELAVTDAQMRDVEAVFAASPVLSQGNPAVAKHPMKRSECRRIRVEAGLDTAREPACAGPNMVPLWDPDAGQTAADAKVCIDQFEFPDIPCEYPVVHVRASEAAQICRAIGKRLCDAHEWEGACAGAVRDPDVEYAWGRPRMEQEWYHNHDREKVWAYGPKRDMSVCATGSFITEGCPGGGWTSCGSNTYPAGAFPLCRSAFDVYDQHGNAAEHMSLPLVPGDLASRGGDGVTEMKGSWFVFATITAHEDDCRWRAPSWHETRVSNEQSHMNYHLGFRCCSDVGGT
jgi:formylglycine-generating enzyme